MRADKKWFERKVCNLHNKHTVTPGLYVLWFSDGGVSQHLWYWDVERGNWYRNIDDLNVLTLAYNVPDYFMLLEENDGI